jgi:hypothetical protein
VEDYTDIRLEVCALHSADDVIRQIEQAFGLNVYPGDSFLQGSFEGCEPYEEVGAFVGKTEWKALDAKMLDTHYCALAFFTEAGFRFFLPAYLIADVRDELQTATPVFHLTHGFHSFSVEVNAGAQKFTRSTGGSVLLNPRRYGAMTWQDHGRYRLSAFTREEAAAIVAYLEFKRERDTLGVDAPAIDAALDQFWRSRAVNAPTRQMLEQHLSEEARFSAALTAASQQKP